jgi:protein SCO1/2
MNRRAMPRPSIALLAALLALAACGPNTPANHEPPPLAGASIGGPFALTDQHGQTVRWSDFRGRYPIVYFGYTYCPDICPTDVQRTIQGIKLFAKDHPAAATRLQPIFITVDPDRDTPKVLGQFTSAFSDKLIGLTGTPEQIAAAAKEFGVYYEKQKPEANGAYLVGHSSVTYLFGPDGKPIATLPTDIGPEAIAAELAKWVN